VEGNTGRSGLRVRSLGAPRHGGTRVVRQFGAGLFAGALSLFSGGIVGHALSISTTTLTAGTNPTVWGQSVTFTATITPVAPAPTGTVTFQDGGSNIAGCVNKALVARVATCATAALAVGSHTITAVYSGNATYALSTSAPVVQMVNVGTTSTLVGSSANPSVSGQTVTYTATVTAVAPASGTRTGTVDFQDGGVDIPGCGAKAVAAAGTATCAIAYAGPGSHTITAIYSGDANFTGSTAPGLTQTVNRGATTTVLISSVNPSSTGANVTFTANVTATAPASGTRTGTVDFQVGGVDIVGCTAQAVPVSGKATCVTNSLAVGASTISAIYSGDVDFTTSTSALFTQTVNQGATATKVVSSLNPSSTGVIVTFTATVTATAPASGTRTGTVAFQDGGVAIAGCGAQVLTAGGTATCATSGLAAGSHPITAIYSGDGNFTTSTSPVLTQTVLSTTTTTVTSSANPSVFGQSVQYTATVAGGPTVTGIITFRDGGSNIAGCVAVVIASGSASCTVSPTVAAHAITAVYSGDASNAASTSAVMTQIVTADPTTTVVTATANPTVFGQSVTFTATVTASAPGSGTSAGNVAFKNGAATIGGCGSVALSAGVATCTTTALSVGVHSITGVYNGNASYRTSTSAVLIETVNLGSTTAVSASSVNPSVSGQSVTYTATVKVVAPAAGVPTGRVNFEDGGVSIAGCSSIALAAAGTAACSITYAVAGTHTITAIYSGDSSFATSTSPSLTQTVNAASTSTSVASSVNPSVAGQSVTITATVSAIAPGSGTRTGAVNFQDGGLTITGCAAQAVSAVGTATCSTSFATVGAHPLTAIYSGDANFTGSTSPSLTENVNQGATSTLVSSSVDPSVPGQIVVYTVLVVPTAPASGTPTSTATFMDSGSPIGGCIALPLVGGVASCSVAYGGVATHSITAVYGGDGNFTGSTSPALTQTVNQGATAAAVTSSVNPSVSGQGLTYTAIVDPLAPAIGTPTGTATFMDAGSLIGGCGAVPLVGGVASCSVAYAGAGIHTITATYSGDANFLGATSQVLTQTINQGATATDITSSVNPSVSGEGLSYTVTVTAVVPASGTPIGTATFMDGGSIISGCAAQPLGGGAASCNVVYAGVGTHVITVIFSGDANFIVSTSSPLTQTVGQGATATVASSSVNPSVPGQVVAFTAVVTATAPASGTPTGTLTFMDGASLIGGCVAQSLAGGVATCTVVYAGVGSHTISAVYSGDPDFTASMSTVFTQTINQGATATDITSSVNPSVSGEGLSYIVTVTAVVPASGTPTGSVTFMDGGSPIGGCVAVPLVSGVVSCSVAYAGAGSHSITAVSSGDPNFTSSTSPALTQTVNPGVTTTVVTSSANPSVSGQGVTYTAIVAPVAPASGTPTGTTTFMDGTTTISGCSAQPLVGGVAWCSASYPGIGTHAITATYNGDSDFIGSTSPIFTQTINQGATAAVITSAVNPSIAGQGVSFTATVSAVAPASGTPTGTVLYMDGTSTLAGCVAQPLVAAVSSCTVTFAGVSTHTVTAVYSGDADFTASTSPALTQSVVAGASAVKLTSPTNSWSSGLAGTFTATVAAAQPASGTPTGTAAFMDAGIPIAACAVQPLVAGVASCSAVYWAAGVHAITAVYSGNRNLDGSASPTFLLTVYEYPPVPDTGGHSAGGGAWGYLAMLGGVILVFLLGCARLRRRGTGKD
jgi:large repetitive protein